MYKLRELSVTDLVGDLQVFELHHFLSRKGQMDDVKGKSIVFKTTKGNGSCIKVNTTVVSDEISSLDEEEMDLLGKKFTKLLKRKKSSSGGIIRDNSSKRGSRLVKDNDDLNMIHENNMVGAMSVK